MTKFLRNIFFLVFLLTAITGVFFYKEIFAYDSSWELDECTPYNVEIDQIDTGRVRVKWETREQCIGYVRYGEDPELAVFMAVDVKGGSKYKKHESLLTNMKSSTTYYLTFFSQDNEYGYRGTPLVIQ